MNFLTAALFAGLGILTLWGVISPRSEWRMVVGWSRRDAYLGEPGPAIVGLVRVVSVIALATLIFLLVRMMA
ncbi:hypothetical protein BH09ACT1_BH09ACT1_13830 [soil metagenome]